jgi:EAL domain-containing protein (putative c-di-GMP-specific phosphodiesterase class I)
MKCTVRSRAARGEKAGYLLDQLRALVKTTSLGIESETELEMLKELEQKLARGDYLSSSKLAHLFSYLRKGVTGTGPYRRPAPPGDSK